MDKLENTRKAYIIYVFAIHDDNHADCLKIGMTTWTDDDGSMPPPNSETLKAAARHRIDQCTRTAAIPYELLHAELAIRDSKDGEGFIDDDVHKVLLRSGYCRKYFDYAHGAKEWFVCDLATAVDAIKAVKEGRDSLGTAVVAQAPQPPIVFRPEQRDAIDKTVKKFKGGGRRMLWNAKMRFGKTICALQMAREMDFRRTIILTHRPVVDEGWFKDFKTIFADKDDWHYGSKSKGETFAKLLGLAKGGGHIVYFASMQDLRGSQLVGGKFDKNDEVFATKWDCLVVDEAHEGTTTELGLEVKKSLHKGGTRLLELSGTPFNLLDDYSEDETFTWDYVMEQQAKATWDATRWGDSNPYASLPELRILTYDLGTALGADYADEGDLAFNFREFFRTGADGAFVHASDVARLLDLMCTGNLYPYSTDEYRQMFRHTLWVVPGVREAKALCAALRAHSVFGAFEVVNVAGDGDGDDERGDALQLVNKAIYKDPDRDPDQTRTITITCGRLTTGVSVGPWMAVLMLAGSSSTSAAAYMQTIFRVQTPFSHAGRYKQICYAFDFAPDRTLRVLASTARLSARAGGAEGGERKALGEFLNFCPVISIGGSRMEPYDVNRIMDQLKRAQIEKVVRCGFEDGALYNDKLLQLSDIDLRHFRDLRGVIGQTVATPRPPGVDINSQGLTNEEYEVEDDPDAPPAPAPRKPTPEEREKQRRAGQRREAISILRGISIRMPLLIFGADLADEDEGITIDNFTDIVDDVSWEEFMPRGVSKERFRLFSRYYEPDIFRGAGRRIREMTRQADALPVEMRIARIAAIFNTFRNPDKETVLTPWRVVNLHLCEALGGWSFFGGDDYSEPLASPRFAGRAGVTEQVFAPRSVILEVNSKSGLYALLAAYDVYRARCADAEARYGAVGAAFARKLWDETVENNILALCKTPMARSITRRTLVGFRDVKVCARYYKNLIDDISRRPETVVATLRGVTLFWGADKPNVMNIDAVIGNPPYQKLNKGAGNGADPLYHHFLNLAMRLSDKCTLIHPARFLFNAGKTPKEWNEKMLNCQNLKLVRYWAKSNDVFPSVDIKGGVAITLFDKAQKFAPIGFFSAFEELRSILAKVGARGGGRMSDIVYPRELYHLTETLYKENPLLDGRQSAGHRYSLGANIFDIFPEVFSASAGPGLAGVYGRADNRRCYKWVKMSYITRPENFGAYKVIIPEANGTGAIGEVLSTPIIGQPIIGHTDTFLSVGNFETEAEAENCRRYICTKFARTMLGTLKATQHNPRDTWANVPMQDFTVASDIDWSAPIADIDRQLYRKYGLTPEEVAFVEERVRAME